MDKTSKSTSGGIFVKNDQQVIHTQARIFTAEEDH